MSSEVYKMYKYEIDPTRTVGTAERTWDAGWTDEQTDRWTDGVKPIYIPLYNFVVYDKRKHHITGPVWGESTSNQWIPLHKGAVIWNAFPCHNIIMQRSISFIITHTIHLIILMPSNQHIVNLPHYDKYDTLLICKMTTSHENAVLYLIDIYPLICILACVWNLIIHSIHCNLRINNDKDKWMTMKVCLLSKLYKNQNQIINNASTWYITKFIF